DKFGTGQAMSYSRKYAFLNLLNLKTGIKDDDGFTAKPFKQNSVEKSAEPTYMDDTVDVEEIKNELKNAKNLKELGSAKNKHRDSVHFLLKNNLRSYRQVTDIAETRELQLNNVQQ
ncbi:MAG: ERF family protein, partial [Polaribacter sp.]|uniref:ERF family protein n=1 Tax=Polaribacter sp. TaxID=1920175 RepID=UPI0038511D3D